MEAIWRTIFCSFRDMDIVLIVWDFWSTDRETPTWASKFWLPGAVNPSSTWFLRQYDCSYRLLLRGCKCLLTASDPPSLGRGAGAQGRGQCPDAHCDSAKNTHFNTCSTTTTKPCHWRILGPVPNCPRRPWWRPWETRRLREWAFSPFAP